MKRIGIDVAIAFAGVIVLAVGLLISLKFRADRVDALVAACRADGVSYRKFVGDGGGYIAYNHPKVATAAEASAALIGKSRNEIRRTLGNPDYVVPRFEATNFGSCEWVYVAQGCKFAGVEFEGTDLFTVAFDEHGTAAVTERKQDDNSAYVKAACQKILDRQHQAEARRVKQEKQ